MLTSSKVLEYQGNPITFDFSENSRMINATEMAKPFGKKPAHFLRLQQTEFYIAALWGAKNTQVADSQPDTQGIVKVVNGGTNNGTWMHEELALKFAAWLSPRFEVWVFGKIKELLLQGHTSIQPPQGTDQDKRIEALERKLYDMEFNFSTAVMHIACAFYHKEIFDTNLQRPEAAQSAFNGYRDSLNSAKRAVS